MSALRVKAMVVVSLMAASFAGAGYWRPTERLADRIGELKLVGAIPEAFGDWKVDGRQAVQLVSPDLQKVIDTIYADTLTRTYVNSQGQRIMLSIAYGGDQSDATRAHRPEVCYPAQGFQVRYSREAQYAMPHGPLRVRQLLSQSGSRVEPISYWMMVGGHAAVGSVELKLAQMGYSTRGIIPDGMLVRVSSIDPDDKHAYQVHQRFLADMGKALSAENYRRIVGGSSS